MYKYLSSFFEEILTSPSLKMTHVALLNDIEEEKTHENYSQLITRLPAIPLIINEYKRQFPSKSEAELIHIAKERSLQVINEEIQRKGVISLCTNPLNDMMWGLYANAQKGVCVEYDITNLCSQNELHKVTYCNSKYDIKNFHPIDKSLPYLWKFVTTTALTRKKESWSKEEEFRFIIDLHYADRIIAIKPSEELKSSLSKHKHLYEEHNDGSLTIEPYGSVDLHHIARHPEVLCLKKLNKNDIKSICFGEKAPQEHIEKAKDIITKVTELKHVELYKYINGRRTKVDF
ncbi:DUF2971 domain-containing protein [Aeromonas eucrenophila]|uniref:DUF2971 domain-containing protein n=1 Tax=Aeromonas eucrenophila TaxID=649 RepID=A0ABW0YB02_9GAMM|nr:DUF2971 domain-containing protein [Aeromonas eucrenophila]